MEESQVLGLCAIVTGGANGIGEAIARWLVHGGANVTILDYDERGEGVAIDTKERGPGACNFVKVRCLCGRYLMSGL